MFLVTKSSPRKGKGNSESEDTLQRFSPCLIDVIIVSFFFVKKLNYSIMLKNFVNIYGA